MCVCVSAFTGLAGWQEQHPVSKNLLQLSWRLSFGEHGRILSTSRKERQFKKIYK